MEHYDYLIIGGGMASLSAVQGIRRRDRQGTVAIFSNERYPVYNRPPLSKKLWAGEPFESVWMRPDTRDLHVVERLTTTVSSINPRDKTITDEYGNISHYTKLLLAVGGKPVELPFHDVPILYFRTLDDYFSLRRLADTKTKFLVIGGGFIGSEIAAALSINQKEVSVIYPEPHLVDRFFPEDLKRIIDAKYVENHVQLLANDALQSLTRDGDTISAVTRSGKTLNVEAVVAGIGIRPNTELAHAAGLQINDGIVVNEYLQTSEPDIYAAGDVASFRYPYPDQRSRVEHEDNALVQGRWAGENMAGANKIYTHLPFFYSDMFSFGYEAIGNLDYHFDIFADWVNVGEEGVLYYLHNKKVVGILNWNVWDGIPKARRIIEEQKSYDDPQELKGKIRNA